MSDTLEDLGNCVCINGRLIPAVNIQVENVPGMITYPSGDSAWYGIYFEILFEDGSLWVVEQKSKEDADDYIYVTIYDEFYKVVNGTEDYTDEPDFGWCLQTWDEMLENYDRHLNALIFRADYFLKEDISIDEVNRWKEVAA